MHESSRSEVELPTILTLARQYVAAGLSVIPIRRDGSKAPALPSWKAFQSRLPAEEELTAWFAPGRSGIAILGGAVSGGLEILDFDRPDLWDQVRTLAAEQGLPDLWDQVVWVKTPAGGRHGFFRSPTPAGNLKLAQGETGETWIETRGEGGYVLAVGCPPECHPAGKSYRLCSGKLTAIPTFTPAERAALLDLARTFTAYAPPEMPFPPPPSPGRNGTRPGDDYNARGDYEAVLARGGWQRCGTQGEKVLWRRPGKPGPGISATTNYEGRRMFTTWSTAAAPFEAGRHYGPFQIYALLEHDGDFSAAAQQLAGEGYGEPAPVRLIPAAVANRPVEETRIFHRTDLGNAERMIAQHGEELRYCHAWGKWVVWDGTRWKTDDTAEIHRLATATIRSMYHAAAAEDDAETREKLAKWAAGSESHARIMAMLAEAQNLAPVVIRPEQLDADPWKFNVRNGTLDLRQGTLVPHRREDLLSKLAPVDFSPEADAPQWHEFLSQIMARNGELVRFLQRAVGYALTGDISEQVLFLLFGIGSNGKSTFLETLLALWGEYGLATPTETLTLKKGEPIPNDLARLQGARLVTAVETEEGKRLAESRIKQMTSREPMVARFLHQEFFEFRPTFKLFLATNHKPPIRGTDLAIWRRLKLLPFEVVIPAPDQDKSLGEKLLAELPGILAWAVQGCLRWQGGGLGVPPEVTSATENYRSEQDVLAAYLREACVVDPKLQGFASKVYSEYVNWCKRNGEFPEKHRGFAAALRERGFHSFRSTGNMMRWNGLDVLGLEEED